MAPIEIQRHDASQLSRLREGDTRAFDDLYGRYQPPVYRYLLRMSGSPELAEDTVQEVFLTLIRGARGYDPGAGPLGSYLYGIARNLLLRQWRSERPVEDLDEDAPAPESDPLENLTRGESVELLRHALLGLPVHYREVVVLCELEELPYADAAETLGVPVGTVRSRLNRARTMLVARMSASRKGVRA